MRLPRASGVLLHPTSLPGPWGIGDLGPEAFRFVDQLAGARQTLWQVLPLGPTGYGDSPYQCFSTFAGNPLLVSPELLRQDGLLDRDEVDDPPPFPSGAVRFGEVIPYKRRLLHRAARRFLADAGPGDQAGLERFAHGARRWLDDFALFMALKDRHGGEPWTTWDAALVRREPDALARWRDILAEEVRIHQVLQYLFARQWGALRQHANARGVRVLGDIPIFVAHDSVDVWRHPELFHLDEGGHSTVVAGVPPDSYSETGQLWGNPLYRWDVLAECGYSWWVERVVATLGQVDVVRLDHFIGFTRYWEVPASAAVATHGRWLPGPGSALFEAILAAVDPASVVVEDLGPLTPEVHALRERLALPGMKLLQFGFIEGQGSPYLPHTFSPNCVAYTSTHDSPTALGWYAAAPDRQRDFARRYLGCGDAEIVHAMIRCVMASVADTVILPIQDVLGLGDEGRMNRPGHAAGNWAWRLAPGALRDAHRERLAEMVGLYDRAAAPTPP